MTLRLARIQRRASEGDALGIDTEVAAAGMLWTWSGFRTPEWSTRRFWAGIARTHGDRINAKVSAACPGCRAGYRYALGEFPPVPLVEELPANHLGHREQTEIDGVRHWFIGPPWQRCQAEHLRDLGECDGAEWRRYVAWRDAGFPPRYVPDESPDDRPMALVHLCH